MIVNLHIDRLVLDGLPVGAHEVPLIETAIRAELHRLLVGDRAPHPRVGRRAARLDAPPIETPHRDPAALGAQIARAIHEGITR